MKLTEEQITAVYIRLLLMPLPLHARITLLSLASYLASEAEDDTWQFAHQPSNQDVIYAWYRFSLDNRSFWDPAFNHDKQLPSTEKRILDSFKMKLELDGFSSQTMAKKQKKQVSILLYEEYLKLLRNEVAKELYVTSQELQEIRTLVDGIRDQSTRGEELQQDMGSWSQEKLSRRLRFDNSALRERQFQQGSQSRKIQAMTSQEEDIKGMDSSSTVMSDTGKGSSSAESGQRRRTKSSSSFTSGSVRPKERAPSVLVRASKSSKPSGSSDPSESSEPKPRWGTTAEAEQKKHRKLLKNQDYIPYALRQAFQRDQQNKAEKTWVNPRKKIFVANHYPGLEVGRQLNVGEGSQES
ncbi:MAG: hypothetical protein GY799_24285, partial [Desulfobulbaceae bacterium]|nr:hypothetical protein [Desulfobulbaceae bacterium]